MYHAIPIEKVKPEQDMYVALPIEQPVPGTKSNYHRCHIRSQNVQYDNATIQLAEGCTNVVQSSRGLSRVLLRFPQMFCPGIKAHVDDKTNKTQYTLGFALYDSRNEERTKEEEAILSAVDSLSAWLRRTFLSHKKIRKVLNMHADMGATEAAMAADMLDVHISRPLAEDQKTRYVYTKLVPPAGNVPVCYHTVFWSPEGKRVPFNQVLEAGGALTIEPLVEIEELFASKSVRSLQLRTRECIVHLRENKVNTRQSLCFPEVAVEAEQETEEGDALGIPVPATEAESKADHDTEAAQTEATEVSSNEGDKKREHDSVEDADAEEPATKRSNLTETAQDNLTATEEP